MAARNYTAKWLSLHSRLVYAQAVYSIDILLRARSHDVLPFCRFNAALHCRAHIRPILDHRRALLHESTVEQVSLPSFDLPAVVKRGKIMHKWKIHSKNAKKTPRTREGSNFQPHG